MTNEEKRFLLQVLSNEIIQRTLNLPGLNQLDFNIMKQEKRFTLSISFKPTTKNNNGFDMQHLASTFTHPQPTVCSCNHQHQHINSPHQHHLSMSHDAKPTIQGESLSNIPLSARNEFNQSIDTSDYPAPFENLHLAIKKPNNSFQNSQLHDTDENEQDNPETMDGATHHPSWIVPFLDKEEAAKHSEFTPGRKWVPYEVKRMNKGLKETVNKVEYTINSDDKHAYPKKISVAQNMEKNLKHKVHTQRNDESPFESTYGPEAFHSKSLIDDDTYTFIHTLEERQDKKKMKNQMEETARAKKKEDLKMAKFLGQSTPICHSSYN